MLKKKPVTIKDDRKYVATFRIKKTGEFIYWRYKSPKGAEKTALEESDRWELVCVEEIK